MPWIYPDLKVRREAKGWSAAEAVKQIIATMGGGSCTEQTLWAWEHGRGIQSHAHYRAVVALFGPPEQKKEGEK